MGGPKPIETLQTPSYNGLIEPQLPPTKVNDINPNHLLKLYQAH